ncbi:MAG: hypothetical protein AB1700_20680, partial [Bacillota bacterium]
MKRYISYAVAAVALILGLAVGGAAASPTPILDLEPARAVIGETVVATGTGFVPGTQYDLVWRTFKGSWKLTTDEEGHYTGSFLGPQFEAASVVLATVTADGNGRFAKPIVVPEDFGGVHDVAVVSDGKEVTKAGLR